MISSISFTMRTYKRKRGAKPYKTTYDEESMVNAEKAVAKGETLGRAALRFGVPKSTLYRKCRGLNAKRNGRQTALSDDCERLLAAAINQLAEWKVPLDGWDIRMLVKHMLDTRHQEIKVFKDNLPGNDWLRAFMKRKNLVKRYADYVKPKRFEISAEELNNFYDELTVTINGVPPANIFNFDETNLADDPSRKECVVRRGFRRVETKNVSSKQGFSVLFCGNAEGLYLPPMTVYKGETKNVFSEWVKYGPKNAVYASTPSGWFNFETFEAWFMNIFLPHAKTLPGPKVLIGDNAPAHLSITVVNECLANNIRFTTLVPNCTHLLQPLDVAVFRPLKRIWRNVLDEWRKKSRSRQCLSKSAFSQRLKTVHKSLDGKHLIAGFKACGIVPLNREETLSKLPGKSHDKDLEEVLNGSVLKILQQHCQPPTTSRTRKRGHKVKAVPGRGMQPLDAQEESTDVWTCHFCGDIWEEDDNRWLLCDVCSKAYHLQCSGIQYQTADYYEFDIEGITFSCEDCC